jgi:hypothetical protein
MEMMKSMGMISLVTSIFFGWQHAAAASGLDSLIAEYTFHEGSGSTVHDISGMDPVMHLAISNQDGVTWVEGGLRINSGRTLLWSQDKKIYDACTATDEISISAWVRPASTTMTGPTRVVTFSEDAYLRNFTLGIEGLDWVTRLRTTQTSLNGMPNMESGTVETRIMHVAYTRNASGEEFFYVDGVVKASGTRSGSFTNWDSTHVFGLGNEINPEDDRQFYGTFYRVNIYSRALSAAEVAALYQQGYAKTIPAPVIRANGGHGDVTVSPNVPVTVTVTITDGNFAGTAVDWFAIAVPPTGGEWYYLAANMQWTGFPANSLTLCRPVYGGPLTDIYNPAKVLDRCSFSSPGTYYFYFIVDYPMNGTLDLQPGYNLYDRVRVLVE